ILGTEPLAVIDLPARPVLRLWAGSHPARRQVVHADGPVRVFPKAPPSGGPRSEHDDRGGRRSAPPGRARANEPERSRSNKPCSGRPSSVQDLRDPRPPHFRALRLPLRFGGAAPPSPPAHLRFRLRFTCSRSTRALTCSLTELGPDGSPD